MKLLRAAIVCATLSAFDAGTAQAQPYSGPPSSTTRYWEEPAFSNYPLNGPQEAVGIIYWSHDTSGILPRYQFRPPTVIVEFAKRNWDVVKVQRNPVFDTNWGNGGPIHADGIVERAKKARASGYQRVIAAGQSFGGAISLEAAARTDQIFGVLAFAPEHGTNVCGGDNLRRPADVISGLVERVKAPRIVVTMADVDNCTGGDRPGPQIEQLLGRMGAKHIYLGSAMPIRGRNAASLFQFSVWYSNCLIEFMTPTREPAPGRTECPPPPSPRFLVPANFKFEAAPGAGTGKLDAPSDFAGQWLGKSGGSVNGQEVCLVLEKVNAVEATGTLYFGAGPTKTDGMTMTRITAQKSGDDYIHKSGENFEIKLTLSAEKAEVSVAMIVLRNFPASVTRLRRGCAG